jgi:hypothetical protein
VAQEALQVALQEFMHHYTMQRTLQSTW